MHMVKNILRTIRVNSIRDYISPQILSLYETEDMNVTEANIYHTKMMLKDIDLQNYLFNTDVNDISEKKRKEYTANIRREMKEIFKCGR